MYIKIHINNNPFSVEKTPQKPQKHDLALKTLKDIESVFEVNLGHINESLSAELLLQAETIRNRYLEKTAKLSCSRRLFGGISRKEKEIQAIYERIENRVFKKPIIPSAKEITFEILKYLSAQDMAHFSQVNRKGQEQGAFAKLRRAKELGYQGDDVKEANAFLKDCFLSVRLIAKTNLVPKDTFVYLDKHLDVEASLLKIRSDDFVKKQLSEELLRGSKRGDEKMIKALLTCGADPNIIDSDGYTPICIDTSNPQITEELIRRGANVNYQTKEGYTPLHFAAAKGQIESVGVLLKGGANPNLTDSKGRTPLMLAKWDKKLISLLLERGADSNIANSKGFTPICFNTSDPKITQLLCDKGANVNFQTSQNGYTALHFAAEKGQMETVKVLLKNGANSQLTTMNGKKPSELTKNKQIKKLLETSI